MVTSTVRRVVLIVLAVAAIIATLALAFATGWLGNLPASDQRYARWTSEIAGIVAVVAVVAQFPLAAAGRLFRTAIAGPGRPPLASLCKAATHGRLPRIRNL